MPDIVLHVHQSALNLVVEVFIAYGQLCVVERHAGKRDAHLTGYAPIGVVIAADDAP